MGLDHLHYKFSGACLKEVPLYITLFYMPDLRYVANHSDKIL